MRRRCKAGGTTRNKMSVRCMSQEPSELSASLGAVRAYLEIK